MMHEAHPSVPWSGVGSAVFMFIAGRGFPELSFLMAGPSSPASKEIK